MNSVNIIGRIVDLMPLVYHTKRPNRAWLRGTIRVPFAIEDRTVTVMQSDYKVYFEFENTPGYLERLLEKLEKNTKVAIMGRLTSRPTPGMEKAPYTDEKNTDLRTSETLHVAQVLVLNMEIF